MQTADFLVELGTEELPPKALKKLRDAFVEGMQANLKSADLAFGEVKGFAAPRRLAVWVKGVQLAQADKAVERKGPSVKANEKAIEGFARSAGVALSDLVEVEGYWMHRFTQAGQSAAALLPAMVEDALNKLPIPKRMRWGASEVEFVRPVHWLVMLLGDAVVPATILGLPSGRTSFGHRFHHPDAIEIQSPSTYLAQMADAFVLADFEARRAHIRAQVEKAAAEHGGVAVIDEELLDEVTALNENPHPVVGGFDAHFLDVPAECLISTMKANQKYFHMLDADGKLMAKFITLANIQSSNVASVREGNEKVVRPRLKDADFFWNQDKKQRLEDRLPALKTVVFQQKLGTLMDKVERVETLAGETARMMGENVELACRAARLSKCDLMTNMVNEFPELQGIMGRYYAMHDGEHAQVAEALDDQYKPRFAGDSLPQTATGRALAIADKLDTITGIYGIGQVPTGDKDPFALRRAALGVLRIMIECHLALDLKALIAEALKLHPQVADKAEQGEKIYQFMMERLKAYYADQGMGAELFEAVMAVRPASPLDFDKRIRAVHAFSAMDEAQALAAANKRIANILRKVEGDVPAQVNAALFAQAEESALFDRFNQLESGVQHAAANGDYTQVLKTLAQLRGEVDAFFEGVMVMAEDEAVKNNRLALLGRIGQAFMQVADISGL